MLARRPNEIKSNGPQPDLIRHSLGHQASDQYTSFCAKHGLAVGEGHHQPDGDTVEFHEWLGQRKFACLALRHYVRGKHMALAPLAGTSAKTYDRVVTSFARRRAKARGYCSFDTEKTIHLRGGVYCTGCRVVRDPDVARRSTYDRGSHALLHSRRARLRRICWAARPHFRLEVIRYGAPGRDRGQEIARVSSPPHFPPSCLPVRRLVHLLGRCGRRVRIWKRSGEAAPRQGK
jgi:hypothetical protein